MLLQGSGIALDDTLLGIPESYGFMRGNRFRSPKRVMCPPFGSAIVLPLRESICWTLLANVAYFVLGIHVIVREAAVALLYKNNVHSSRGDVELV